MLCTYRYILTAPVLMSTRCPSLCSFCSPCWLLVFHSHLVINWHSPSLWKETEKKRGNISQAGGGGVWDVGRELAAARVSASSGLVHCRQGPPALPPLLSAGSAAAKKWLNKALFICADCIHCTSQLLGCGTTQICPALQRKGRQTCSQQQSA